MTIVSKFTGLMYLTIAIIVGDVYVRVYTTFFSHPPAVEVKTEKKEVLFYRQSAETAEEEVALYCSGIESSCQAKLNDDTILSLKLVGDINETSIILGNEKIPSEHFFEKVYHGNYPRGVARIAYRSTKS